MSEPISVSSVRELSRHVSEEVVFSGWLDNKRSSGKIAFLQVRCGGGTVQVVIVRHDVPEATWADI